MKKGNPMSVENIAVVETSAAVETVATEKVARIVLPEVAVENYKALEISAVKGAVVINVSDLEEYAQVAAVVKTLKAVKYVSGNKGAIIVVDAQNLANAEKLLLLNPEIKNSGAAIVIINITYNGAEKLRLSAKTTGESKVKKSARAAFFDISLDGMVDMGEFNYICGVEGTDFTKELNTKIVRVVKALVADKKLYSDEDKSGFHKTNSRIPVEARSSDNYAWYFVWSEIKAKLDAAGLNGDAIIADIVKIINDVYPTIVVDTTKTLYVEALVSEFANLKSEKLVFDATTGKIISKKEEAALAKAANAQAKADAKAAKLAEKKATKKATAKEEAAVADVVVEGLTPAVEITPIAVEGLVTAEAAPVMAPVAPVMSPAVDAAALINGLNVIGQ